MDFVAERFYRAFFGTPFRTVRTIILIVIAIHFLYFLVIPTLVMRRKTLNPRLRRYLEWVVATPSLLGDVVRADARQRLMILANSEGRYEQAIAQGYAILRHTVLPASYLSEVHRRMADALEGVGRDDEAREQRKLASARLAEAPRDATWYINRGRQLTAANDHANACKAFEEGLAIAPPGPNDARILLTLQLSTSLFQAGRVEESAERAEEAVALVPDRETLYLAHRQAGASYGSLGRLDEAERHRQRAVEIAEALGEPNRLADSLGDLAGLQRKRGELAAALAACDRAAATHTTRHLEAVRYEILRSMGRFDEALAAQQRASQLNPNTTPSAERTIQAVFAYGRASVRMEQGRLDEVSSLLSAAYAGFKGNAKLTLWCDTASARLSALEGRRDDAMAVIHGIERRLAPFEQDNNTRSTVFGNLGRAALVLGEYEKALDFWEAYLAVPAEPVDVPTAYYHLGEAHRGLGDELSARAAYRSAVDTGLDTHHARLAQSRLRTLAV